MKLKQILLFGMLLAGFGTMLAAPAAQAATTYYRSVYQGPAAEFYGDCLTGTALKELKLLNCGVVSGNDTADFNQQWDWIGSGPMQLKNRHHGTCLSVSVIDGAYQPDLQACNSTHTRQQWTRTGDHEWKNRWTGGCLGWTPADRFGMYVCGPDPHITNWRNDVVYWAR